MLLTLLEWMIPITVYDKKCKETKIIESFQISATLFHLLLQSRFPTIWLTLLFPLAWRVKYMLIRLITCVKSLVPLILFTSTSFYVSERSAGLIWSIHFDMSLASNKKRKTSKGLLWDDTQMTSMKIVQFSYSPLLHLRSKVLPPPESWMFNFKRNPPHQMITNQLKENI